MSETKTVAAYGSWPSPVDASMLTSGAVGLVDVWVDGSDTYWLESRPSEAGRLQIVRLGADGVTADVLPDGFSARTAAHEYGGGAALVAGGTVWFSNWADQRLYRLDVAGSGAPVALSPEPEAPRSVRFADFNVSQDGRWLLAARETHSDHDVVNEIVVMSATEPSEPTALVSGPDFVSSPRFVGGGRLRWVQWNNPNMPWDVTTLVQADFVDGSLETVVELATGASVMQPIGDVVMSDAGGYWNPWIITATDKHNLLAVDDDLAGPAWTFGNRDYVVTDSGKIITTTGSTLYIVTGRDHLSRHELPVAGLSQLVYGPHEITAIATYVDREDEVVRFDIDRPEALTVLRPARDLAASYGLTNAGISSGSQIEFPTTNRQRAFGWYYPPASATHTAPAGERPPLVVMIHGGPTAAARPGFSLAKQYWTSRGFAVVDVDYRGSTGYGRTFRRLLNRQWGVVDVDDCCAAASYLAENRVDPQRLVIRGGSAGGFTVLAVLSRRKVFKAGASYFGVADLAALATDTHKFEARYLDSMIGPWPQDEAVYAERSPINHVDGIDVPLIVFQGEDDMVVPQNQSEMIVAAVRANGVRCDYHLYAGEGHGFRRADTIVDSIEAELAFYRSVFGIDS